MPTTLEVLKQARQLISEPGHWTKGALARDKNHKQVPPLSPDACSWCSIGAVVKVVGSEELAVGHLIPLNVAITALHPNLPTTSVGDFNDGNFNRFRNHSEVLAVFDEAIKNARNS